MPRSNAVAQQYFDKIKKNFATNQYLIASDAQNGIVLKQKPNPSPAFFDLLQQNIDSPGLLTDNQRDSIIDFLLYL